MVKWILTLDSLIAVAKDQRNSLSCRKGGLVIRHNEVRDAIGDLSVLAWGQVFREPIVRESDIRNKSPALVADLVIGGVWSDQSEMFVL